MPGGRHVELRPGYLLRLPREQVQPHLRGRPGPLHAACGPREWRGDCAQLPFPTPQVPRRLREVQMCRRQLEVLRIGGEYALRCSFGEKEYNWGQVNFECREKGWAFVNQTCSACAASGPFNVTYGHDVGVFELPSAESDGEIQDMPCKFGATSFSSGVVRFACKGGRWRLQTVTCVNSGAEEPPEPSTPELQG
mmetsp:Transcript_80279/g.247545  ORF Transcript_80279/g.247545 Transcript_80279/m.247545 type:complete len:194 (-) Transcript_80279:98-679(-)